MNDQIFTFILILLLVMITFTIINFIRKKIAKPEYEKRVQKRGKFETFIVRLLILIAIFTGILTVFGIATRIVEMAIVSAILTLLTVGIIVLIKREYNLSYQEEADYFILKARGKEYHVFYDDIIDWRPAFNEIRVLDKSRSDRKYIRVNIVILRPEKLLRKIVEMTFAGKFYHFGEPHLDDPNREHDLVYFLVNYDYGYLVGDYIKE